jgi:hypothetical protein
VPEGGRKPATFRVSQSPKRIRLVLPALDRIPGQSSAELTWEVEDKMKRIPAQRRRSAVAVSTKARIGL